MRILFYAIWLVVLGVFQPTLARGMEIWGIAPNLFLCFVVMVGFFRGTTEGAICGAVFGLIYDILIGRLIGVNSLIYLYLGFGAGMLGGQFFSSGKQLVGALSVAAATVFASICYCLALKAVNYEISWVTALLRIGLTEAVYNAVISFLLAYPLKWSLKWMRISHRI